MTRKKYRKANKKANQESNLKKVKFIVDLIASFATIASLLLHLFGL